MPKKLSFEDLVAEKEKEAEDVENIELEDMYDLIIPPGTPSYIIYDLVEEFNLEPVDRRVKVNIVDCDERDVLALRGQLEDVQEAEQILYRELKAWAEDQE
ncbi:conserved hypothetical protein [Methanosalsum zhilinae DSM 4017]|uniref:Uncharacterized protein n=1 Tax=Methanosalsum zhilinae (strain DSM 4017 / NBRC 107636 / OCM 62 / WeN5) TaxID=679901 RepID=F7XPH9_METZD|nr:hypothetical protein [Methanosalsum zhilinae]AEH61404.1 conserved hypothetical protein [Methanosalsum zhilinae DSM 4017]